MFELIQPWSVPVIRTVLHPDIIKELIGVTDNLLNDPNTPSLGYSLAGQIETELVIENDLLSKDCTNILLTFIQKFVTTAMNQKHGVGFTMFNMDFEKQISPKIQITKIWMVSQQPNEYNPLLVHGNDSDISGVLYLKVPEMIPPRKKHGADGHINFSSNASRDVKFSVPSTVFLPKVGDVYIFGAHQQHSVYPYRCEEGQEDTERRSISFNAIC